MAIQTYIVYLQVDEEELKQHMDEDNYRNPEKLTIDNVQRVMDYKLQSTGITLDSINGPI